MVTGDDGELRGITADDLGAGDFAIDGEMLIRCVEPTEPERSVAGAEDLAALAEEYHDLCEEVSGASVVFDESGHEVGFVPDQGLTVRRRDDFQEGWATKKTMAQRNAFLREHAPAAMLRSIEASAAEWAMTMGDVQAAFKVNGRPSAAHRTHRERVREVLRPVWEDAGARDAATNRSLMAAAIGCPRDALYGLMGQEQP